MAQRNQTYKSGSIGWRKVLSALKGNGQNKKDGTEILSQQTPSTMHRTASAQRIIDVSRLQSDEVYKTMRTQKSGLPQEEIEKRLEESDIMR